MFFFLKKVFVGQGSILLDNWYLRETTSEFQSQGWFIIIACILLAHNAVTCKQVGKLGLIPHPGRVETCYVTASSYQIVKLVPTICERTREMLARYGL